MHSIYLHIYAMKLSVDIIDSYPAADEVYWDTQTTYKNSWVQNLQYKQNSHQILHHFKLVGDSKFFNPFGAQWVQNYFCPAKLSQQPVSSFDIQNRHGITLELHKDNQY